MQNTAQGVRLSGKLLLLLLLLLLATMTLNQVQSFRINHQAGSHYINI